MNGRQPRRLWTAIRPDPEYLNKVIDALVAATSAAVLAGDN